VSVTLTVAKRITPIRGQTYRLTVFALATGDATAGTINVNSDLSEIPVNAVARFSDAYALQDAAATCLFQADIRYNDWEALATGNDPSTFKYAQIAAASNVDGGGWVQGLTNTWSLQRGLFLPAYLGRKLVASPVLGIAFNTNTDTKGYRATLTFDFWVPPT